jgi:hypothetical protein
MKYKTQKKLEAFAKREITAIANNMVLADGDAYFLFGQYDLKKTSDQVVIWKNDNLAGTFGNTQIAVAWCIADKFNQVNLAIRIAQLDKERTRYANDINTKRSIASKSKDYEFKETVSIKLANQQYKYKAIDTELSKCVNLAKYWQYRGFNNETQRISSTTNY